MLGAIAGDIIGSVHEFSGTKTTDFDLFHPHACFTDDTVLAVAVADCLLHELDYTDAFHRYVEAYPGRGYGGRFFDWAVTRARAPYNSWGNGSAMRVPAVGWAFDSLAEVRAGVRRSGEVTHNHLARQALALLDDGLRRTVVKFTRHYAVPAGPSD